MDPILKNLLNGNIKYNNITIKMISDKQNKNLWFDLPNTALATVLYINLGFVW